MRFSTSLISALTGIYRRLFTLLWTLLKSLLKMVASPLRISTLGSFFPFSSVCLHSLFFPNPSCFPLGDLQRKSLTYHSSPLAHTGSMDLWVLGKGVGRGVCLADGLASPELWLGLRADHWARRHRYALLAAQEWSRLYHCVLQKWLLHDSPFVLTLTSNLL